MKIAAILMGVLLVSGASYADDNVNAKGENSDVTTVDHSKNPITGSHTTKVKRKMKKNKDGHRVDHESTDTTKVKKDGEVKKDHKSETEEQTNH